MSVTSFVSLTLSVLFLIQTPELSHSFVTIAPSNFATRNCLESNPSQTRTQQRQQLQKQQHKINAPLSSKNNKNILPGEDAFSNKSGSYVPFGLTAEEYAAIKQKEATAQKQKNYGKWGPRFQEVDEAPEGNWITNSILWTKGFQYKDDNGLDVVTKEREDKGTEVTVPTSVLAFFLSFFVVRVMRVLATLVRDTSRRRTLGGVNLQSHG